MEKEDVSKIKAKREKFFNIMLWSAVAVLVITMIGLTLQSVALQNFNFSIFLAFFFASYFGWLGSPFPLGWYYLFYTLGWLVLIYGFIRWLIESRKIKKSRNTENPKTPQKKSEDDTNEKLLEWLKDGNRLLSSGDLREAELLYNHVKKEYDPSKDSSRKIYRKIIDFYQEIEEEKGKKK